MAQFTSRVRNTVDLVVQTLDGRDTDVKQLKLLQTLLDDIVVLQTETNKANENMAKSLDLIVKKLDLLIDRKTKRFNHDLLSKLDTLISIMADTNSKESVQLSDRRKDAYQELQECYVMTENMLHNKKSRDLYAERDILPYAFPVLEDRITANATDDEKRCRCRRAMDDVQTEMKIVEDWIIDWREKISKLDVDFGFSVKSNEFKREVTDLKFASSEMEAPQRSHEKSVSKQNDNEETIQRFGLNFPIRNPSYIEQNRNQELCHRQSSYGNGQIITPEFELPGVSHTK